MKVTIAGMTNAAIMAVTEQIRTASEAASAEVKRLDQEIDACTQAVVAAREEQDRAASAADLPAVMLAEAAERTALAAVDELTEQRAAQEVQECNPYLPSADLAIRAEQDAAMTALAAALDDHLPALLAAWQRAESAYMDADALFAALNPTVRPPIYRLRPWALDQLNRLLGADDAERRLNVELLRSVMRLNHTDEAGRYAEDPDDEPPD